jgi:hypothetical protein
MAAGIALTLKNVRAVKNTVNINASQDMWILSLLILVFCAIAVVPAQIIVILFKFNCMYICFNQNVKNYQ